MRVEGDLLRMEVCLYMFFFYWKVRSYFILYFWGRGYLLIEVVWSNGKSILKRKVI